MIGITDKIHNGATFHRRDGDMLRDRNDFDALVNTVNCEGVMGRGIALQFKNAFKENFSAYRNLCENGEMRLGKVFVHELEQQSMFQLKYIINFPTKEKWRSKSHLSDIEEGLKSLANEIRARKIRSIALPALGCGLGGLDWSAVRESIEKQLGTLNDVQIFVYEPGDPHDISKQIATPQEADPLNLPFKRDRPIVVFDLETTGTNRVHDRIVEMAAVKIDEAGNQEERVRRFNPDVPIPPEATAVHGITDEDVADEPPFASRARSLADFLGTCDLAGFNVRRFDLPLLLAEFRRAGVAFEVGDRRILDMQTIFHREEPRDLTAAAKFYLGREPDRPHSAPYDVQTTIDVMVAQLEKYAHLPKSVQELHAYCDEFAPFESEFVRWFSKTPTGVLVFRRGKHRGTPIDEVALNSPDYLDWMLRAEDMDSEVRDAARDALARFDPNQTTLQLPKHSEPNS